MKRILSASLVLIMCLSLCACGASAPTAAAEPLPTPEPTPDLVDRLYEKYADIIDALEAEDYEAATRAWEARKPAPVVTEVEITLDNLWNYFEITEYRSLSADAQRNPTDVSVAYYLTLKEEYELADLDEYRTDVAVGYEFDDIHTSYYYPCTMDFDTLTCSGSEADRYKYHNSLLGYFRQNEMWIATETLHIAGISLYWESARCKSDQSNVNYWDTAYIDTVENFEILNASGTLYLVNK